MSVHNHTFTPAEVAISALITDSTAPGTTVPGYRLLRTTLRDGIDLLVWRGGQPQPMSMNIRDDWGRVQFSYALQGHAHFSLGAGKQAVEHTMTAGSSCISYTPDCRGKSTHAGQIENVVVSIRPDLLHELAPDMDGALRQRLDSQRCCVPCRCCAEMSATARALSDALQAPQHAVGCRVHRPTMWLLGQSLALTSLMLEAHRDAAVGPCTLPQADHAKLLHARDLLLADLTRAPTIIELAKATGLSEQKLKRGFQSLFQHGVYSLFQHERMHEARRRLAITGMSVMTVATDMGYANASHFTAAFYKQFGVNPSALKQSRQSVSIVHHE
ncbi:helix-turn-helix transcriptional regulator [Burkholderia plantarii]|nr:helix-turn-helix transcriptional regulator [Burkholderia plantarii]